MRKRLLHDFSSFLNAGISGRRTTSNTECVDNKHNSLSSGTSHSIFHADFLLTSSYSGSGGAISLNGGSKKSSTSLSVNECTFTSIQCTGQGGAIYVTSVNSAEIRNSLFNSCKTSLTTGHGGGGIYVSSVNAPLVSDTSLTNCDSPNDGGGVIIYACKTIS